MKKTSERITTKTALKSGFKSLGNKYWICKTGDKRGYYLEQPDGSLVKIGGIKKTSQGYRCTRLTPRHKEALAAGVARKYGWTRQGDFYVSVVGSGGEHIGQKGFSYRTIDSVVQQLILGGSNKARISWPERRILDHVAEFGEDKGVQRHIGSRAILTLGITSVAEGRRILSLPEPDDKKVPLSAIKKAVRDYWEPEDVEAFLRGQGTLRRIKQFRSKHEREYHSAQRSYKKEGGFIGVMEDIYPNLYWAICGRIRYEDIDQERLAKECLTRFRNGLTLSRVGAEHSVFPLDRAFFKKIACLSRNPKFRKADSYYDVITVLSGLNKALVEVGGDAVRDVFNLSELFSSFVLHWGPLVELPEFEEFFPYGEVYTQKLERGMCKINVYGVDRYADLRVGNMAIEDKSGTSPLSKLDFREIVTKYKPGEHFWQDGEMRSLDESLVVFHMKPELYEEEVPYLEREGIKVMGWDVFQDLLQKIVSRIGDRYRDVLKYSDPRIYDLGYLLELHKELSLTPNSLETTGSYERRRFGIRSLEGMINLAREVYEYEKSVA